MRRGNGGGNGLTGDMGRAVDRWGGDMKRRDGEGGNGRVMRRYGSGG